MSSYISLCLLLLPLGFFNCVSSRSKYIEIALDGKWKSTPLFVEASEFMAKESNDLFWSFVNPLTMIDLRKSEYKAEQSQYEVIMEMAETLLSKYQLSLFKFAMSLRMYAPTVEMYNQIGLDRRAFCDVFVEVNNLITCEKFALKGFISLAANQTKPLLLQNDHYYPGSSNRDVVVILYAQLGTPEFADWHNMLVGLAEKGQITYILRHYVPNHANVRSKIRLSGYGVELAIKSTEYKAKDDTVITDNKSKEGSEQAVEDEVQGFLFTTLKELYPKHEKNLADFRQHLIDSTADMAPLKVWQLQDLSFQAAQLVLSSSQINALRMFRDISQNFPSRARSLIKVVVSEDVRREIKSNQKILETTYGIMPGESAFFINGRQADLDIYDVFTLVETLRSEAKLMEGLYQLGQQYNIDDSTMLQLLKLDLKDAETMYAVDVRDPSVIYINDLERDRKYFSWPSSVQDLLRPTFPGMLRHIRRNLFHMVLFVNPADKFCGELLKLAEAFYVHNAPVRIGLVFVVNNNETVDANNDVGVALVRAFNYIMKQDSAIKALSFLTDIYNKDLSVDEVTQSLKKKFGGSFADVVLNPDDWTFRQESASYYERTGLGELPQVLMNGIPMKREDLRGEFEETIVQTILRQTGELQKAVFNGFLQDSMDVLDYLMTRTNVMPRLNSRVLSPPEKYLDFSWDMSSTLVSNTDVFSDLSHAKMSGAIASSLKYLSKRDEKTMRAITHWIVVDLNQPDGRALLSAALRQLRHTSTVRVGIVHNFEVDDTAFGGNSYLLARVIELAVDVLDTSTMKNFVTKLLKEENVEALLAGQKTLDDMSVSNMDMGQFNSQLSSLSKGKFKSHRKFCENVLNFKAGERGIISNGRLIGPLRLGELFIEEDFGLLEKFMVSTSTGKIEKKIKTLTLDADRTSDFIMKVESLLVSSPQKEPRRDISFDVYENSVLRIPPRSDGPAYEVVAILDPTTRAAQKYVPFIMVLQDVVNVHISIFFNCREKLSEMPLKSFYRFVLEPELKFSKDLMVVAGPVAVFDDLPLKPLLTLGMDPPESWLVESVEAVYDLDNICMEEVENAVVARFELEYLLLEGHCYDSMSGNPPRGLQFVLGTNSTPAVVDTIVMANLGYFQFKANPGAWRLQLRHGRSSELYDIVGQDFTDSSADSSDVIVVLDSFKSKIIRIRVNKKAGKEHEDLLSDDEHGGGIWDSLSRFTGNSKETEEVGETTLNIFSLASGHLYERFLRIMMLSVIQNTKSKVKFWFLKNYLSPSFKDFIPHMANEYGFEYELVQYKWPRWLHQQTEKQRIIWGYKILFFDVLFPLNISKIIFVDADQTVRVDLKELHDLDLEGAPYGYTPFCDSRTDMDGYRFWKTGYWSNHLGHRKYHISALYVVDLKKFRRIAAGDRLRGQYQGLSQDPNSLSNLDQDLPNNMIHQVAIKSLPQEWLWCETWCSDSEKARAKTIDLCNNPKTKEPKLTAAMRIIPEWKDRDNEIRQLQDRVNALKREEEEQSRQKPVKSRSPAATSQSTTKQDVPASTISPNTGSSNAPSKQPEKVEL